MPKQEMKRIGLDFTKDAKCPNCGKTISASATFCSDCGTSREVTVSVPEGTITVSKPHKNEFQDLCQRIKDLQRLEVVDKLHGITDLADSWEDIRIRGVVRNNALLQISVSGPLKRMRKQKPAIITAHDIDAVDSRGGIVMAKPTSHWNMLATLLHDGKLATNDHRHERIISELNQKLCVSFDAPEAWGNPITKVSGEYRCRFQILKERKAESKAKSKSIVDLIRAAKMKHPGSYLVLRTSAVIDGGLGSEDTCLDHDRVVVYRNEYERTTCTLYDHAHEPRTELASWDVTNIRCDEIEPLADDVM